MWEGEAGAQADISQPTLLLRPSLEHLARSSDPFVLLSTSLGSSACASPEPLSPHASQCIQNPDLSDSEPSSLGWGLPMEHCAGTVGPQGWNQGPSVQPRAQTPSESHEGEKKALCFSYSLPVTWEREALSTPAC